MCGAGHVVQATWSKLCDASYVVQAQHTGWHATTRRLRPATGGNAVKPRQTYPSHAAHTWRPRAA
eukprot:6446628-Pyramimonas_sp.AAC.1